LKILLEYQGIKTGIIGVNDKCMRIKIGKQIKYNNTK
jgi:hypothetical protein